MKFFFSLFKNLKREKLNLLKKKNELKKRVKSHNLIFAILNFVWFYLNSNI